MPECNSKYSIGGEEVLTCTQHLGTPTNWKHSARYMNIRWYWSDEEADPE